MKLKQKDVDAMREIRLWITKIIIPSAIVLYWCPEIRYWFKEVLLSIKRKLQEAWWKLKSKFHH